MTNFKPMAMLAGAGAAIGGIIGFGVVGPAAVPIAMKVGGAAGFQVAAVAKAEGMIDNAAVKAENAMEVLAEKSLVVAEKFIDMWSKFFLIGYGTSIAFSGSQLSSEMFEKFCANGITSNPTCVGHFLTTTSFQMFSVVAGGCLVREVLKIAIGNKQ